MDVSERWKELAPLPEPRVDMAAVAYSGDIYVVGGKEQMGLVERDSGICRKRIPVGHPR